VDVQAALTPKYWKQTLEQQDTQKLLAANPFRKISMRSCLE